MDRAPYEWGGEEWQAFCEQLLVRRHANSYARMPDTDAGDLGMEGYSTDGTGCAYQCYAPEARETTKRARDQNRKITRDLKKWTDNRTEVARHLGNVTINRWILLTPVHDSKAVTAHARTKEEEIRALGLPFLAPDFRIDVQTVDTHFVAERNQLDQENVGVIKAPPAEIAGPDLDRLTENEPELVRTLEGKLKRLQPPVEAGLRRELRDTMLHAAVDFANLEDHLRLNHAQTYELYLHERGAEERAVKLESFIGAGSKSTYVTEVRERYEARLRREVPALRKGDEADRLSHGALADWLQRCPMDFPETSP